MKYIFVGDTHGQVEIAEHVLKNYPEYHKVFIGDYVDSFDRSVEDQLNLVGILLDAVEQREDITCLLGNHELSYLKSGMRCSGFSPVTSTHLIHLKTDMLKYFKTHMYITDDILCTHAGGTAHVFDSKEELKECLQADDPCLYDIGRFRGGSARYGGVFWCDFWSEYTPVGGLTQIVGHSAHRPSSDTRGVTYKTGCYNIDCLQHSKELLTYDTDTEEFNTVIGEW